VREGWDAVPLEDLAIDPKADPFSDRTLEGSSEDVVWWLKEEWEC